MPYHTTGQVEVHADRRIIPMGPCVSPLDEMQYNRGYYPDYEDRKILSLDDPKYRVGVYAVGKEGTD